jgi:hypothetical protein
MSVQFQHPFLKKSLVEATQLRILLKSVVEFNKKTQIEHVRILGQHDA